MQIEHSFDGSKGAFFLRRDGRRIAEMTYVRTGPSSLIIDHTQVDPSLKGQGVGKELVRTGVEYARQNNLKIVPLCPFAKAEFDKRPEYADVRVR